MLIKKVQHNKKAFTILEALVAIFIFTIVVGITASQFASFVVAQRKLFATQNVVDDIRFTMEAISKEMRTGANFSVSSSPASQIRFNNADGDSVTYRLSDTAIEVSRDNEQSFAPLSSSNIEVATLQFYLSGENSLDNLQPRITIVIEAQTDPDLPQASQTKVSVQTTMSQRNLDS